LKNTGKLEIARHIANHESPGTTKFYGRRYGEISIDEVEPIATKPGDARASQMLAVTKRVQIHKDPSNPGTLRTRAALHRVAMFKAREGQRRERKAWTGRRRGDDAFPGLRWTMPKMSATDLRS